MAKYIEEFIPIILFIIPGFISIKIWEMKVPSRKRKSSEIIIESLIFSMIAIAIYYFIGYILKDNLIIQRTWMVLAIILLPILIPILLVKILNNNIIDFNLIEQNQTAWDDLFSRREICAVAIKLKSGEKIYGYFGEKSYVSSYPQVHDIYIEKNV